MDKRSMDIYRTEYIEKQSEILKQQLENLDDTNKELAIELALSRSADVIAPLTTIKSPIEKMFWLGIETLTDEIDLMVINKRFYCMRQVEIVCESKKYKVDFLLVAVYKDELKFLIVECDGHEFHEKTKKQVEYDKQRERSLIKLGYKIVRFSGSEIYKDHIKCAKEALNILFDITDISSVCMAIKRYKLPGIEGINYF
jgi:very-short-patch-repair endonuclease